MAEMRARCSLFRPKRVLVAESSEQLREGELDALRLALVPCSRPQEVAALGSAYGLHQLNANDHRKVVAAGFDLSRSG